MPTAGGRVRRAALRSALALTLLAAALAGCGEGEVSKAERIERARAYRDAGQLRAAMIELKNAARDDLTDPEIRKLLGEVYLEMHDPAPAAKELKRAIDLGDDDPRLPLALARARLMQYQGDRLLDGLPEPPAGTEPGVAAATLLLRGQAFAQLGMDDDATRSFEAALAADPDNVDVLAALGELKLRHGERDAAGDLLARAEAVDPDAVSTLGLEGELSYARGDYAASEAAYARLMELKATGSPVPPALGAARAQIFLGKVDQAVELLDGLLERSPDDPGAQYHRALAAFRSGDHALAAQLAEAVLRRIPDYTWVYLLAGAATYAQGDFERAALYLRRFVAAEPNHAPARELLEAALRRIERAAGANGGTASSPAAAGRPAGAALDADDRELLGRLYDFRS